MDGCLFTAMPRMQLDLLNTILIRSKPRGATQISPLLHRLQLQIELHKLLQWPRGLRHELALMPRSWFRIPLQAWMSVCLYFLCAVLGVGRGLASGWSPFQRSLQTVYKNKQTPWPASTSEPYRPSYSRLSAKLMSTFTDRGVLRRQTVWN
jgi:hypothetical protein